MSFDTKLDVVVSTLFECPTYCFNMCNINFFLLKICLLIYNYEIVTNSKKIWVYSNLYLISGFYAMRLLFDMTARLFTWLYSSRTTQLWGQDLASSTTGVQKCRRDGGHFENI